MATVIELAEWGTGFRRLNAGLLIRLIISFLTVTVISDQAVLGIMLETNLDFQFSGLSSSLLIVVIT